MSEFRSKLLTLLLGTGLSPAERSLADSLLYHPRVDTFFVEIKEKPLVVVLQSNVCSSLITSSLSDLELGYAIFPCRVPMTCTISPIDVNKDIGRVVKSLISKLMGIDYNIKGYIIISSGITIDDMLEPGALIWALKRCEKIKMELKICTLTVAETYIDGASSSDRSQTIKERVIVGEKESMYSPLEVIERAHIHLEMTGVQDVMKERISLCLAEIAPINYLKRK